MQHPDQKYFNGLLNNDLTVQEELYKKFSGKIKWMVLKNKGTETVAADIFQEVLLSIYHRAKIKNFTLTCPFDAFLYVVCRNKWLKELRKRKTWVTITDTMEYNSVSEIRKKIFGEEHPEYAESLHYMSGICGTKGEYKKALQMIKQALAIQKKYYGEENTEYANSLFDLAILYLQNHDYDSSMQIFEKEIKIWKKILGEQNSRYALHLYFISDMIIYLWQYKKAFTWCTPALALTKQTLGEQNLQYAYCLEGVGSYYYNIGEYEKALPYYKQSLTIKENLYGKDYSDNCFNLTSTCYHLYTPGQV